MTTMTASTAGRTELAVTRSQTEGPYWLPGSPARKNVREPGVPGELLTFRGKVVNIRGKPIEGAWVDVWQADGEGTYDIFGYRLRGHQMTDAEGRFENFTVVLANQDPTKWAPLGIIAIEQNFDCSKTITPDLQNAPVGTGYLIQFANTLNISDIYAASQPFEIKPTSAGYPASSATPQATGAASSSGSSSSGSSQPTGTAQKPSGAGKTATAGLGAAAAVAALGLFLA